MHWNHRRSFLQQLADSGKNDKSSNNRQLPYQIPKHISHQAINGIRLQFPRCPPPRPPHPHDQQHTRIFSDDRLPFRPTFPSFQSAAAVDSGFAQEQTSTSDTCPSSASAMARQQRTNYQPIVIKLDDSDDDTTQPIEQTSNQNLDQHIQLHSNQCHTCSILIDIIDEQALQIRQYTEVIAQEAPQTRSLTQMILQQVDVLAKLARRFVGII